MCLKIRIHNLKYKYINISSINKNTFFLLFNVQKHFLNSKITKA